MSRCKYFGHVIYKKNCQMSLPFKPKWDLYWNVSREIWLIKHPVILYKISYLQHVSVKETSFCTKHVFNLLIILYYCFVFLSDVHVILKINTYIMCSVFACFWCSCACVVLAIILYSISSNKNSIKCIYLCCLYP